MDNDKRDDLNENGIDDAIEPPFVDFGEERGNLIGTPRDRRFGASGISNCSHHAVCRVRDENPVRSSRRP